MKLIRRQRVIKEKSDRKSKEGALYFPNGGIVLSAQKGWRRRRNILLQVVIANLSLCNAASFTLYPSSTNLHFRHRDIAVISSSTTQRKSPRLSNIASSVAAVVDIAEAPVDLRYMEFSLDHNGNDVANHEEQDEHEPVFLLHGLLGQKRNFATFGAALASQLQKKRRIFALDLRNHGDNSHDWRDEMSHSHMSRDVLALMDTLNISRAIVVGHSMGGKIAMNLALSHSHRIAGLVVLDTSPVAYNSSNNPAWKTIENIVSVVRGVKLEPGKTKRDIDVDLRQSVEDPALRAFVLTNLESADGASGKDGAMKILRWKINIESIASELDQIANFVLSDDGGDVDSNLKENQGEQQGNQLPQQQFYDGDTFFINGGASNFVRAGHMPVIAKYFPNYMLTTIRGAGHWVHAEAPDDTLALVKRYLDR